MVKPPLKYSLITLLLLVVHVMDIICFDNLINPSASAQTKSLYQRLQTAYGKTIFSGQTTTYYDELVKKVQRNPVVRGFDMQNYSPHNPWYNWQPYDDGTVASAISWYQSTNRKGIVTFHWHWFSPMGGSLRTSTFYTNYTNFDVRRAVTVGTQQHTATLRDIDAIAVQLKRLQSQKIPILWRPLHEAGGGWFWWGSKTSQQAISLYNIIYNRITTYHGINNLIWIWSTPEPSWYPGHTAIDMIGYDSYPGVYNYGCRTDIYNNLKTLVANRKMVQLSQNGPIPDFNKCWQEGSDWGYFLSWSNLVFDQNTDDHLLDVYQRNRLVIKLEDL